MNPEQGVRAVGHGNVRSWGIDPRYRGHLERQDKQADDQQDRGQSNN